jgi:hypothetical protein
MQAGLRQRTPGLLPRGKRSVQEKCHKPTAHNCMIPLA